MQDTNYTPHLEFKTEDAASAFLKKKEAQGYDGAIHRIMTALPCQADDEEAIEYKYSYSDCLRQWYMKRKFDDIWFVSLWGKDTEEDFLNLKPKLRTYQGKVI